MENWMNRTTGATCLNWPTAYWPTGHTGMDQPWTGPQTRLTLARLEEGRGQAAYSAIDPRLHVHATR
jgi:hypothetical protein